MKKFILLCLLLTLALAGCLSKSAETKASPGHEDNLLFITAPIVDKATGQPVRANVYAFEAQALRDPQPSELASQNSDHIQLALQYLAPDDAPGQSTNWIVVKAEGYQTWAIQLANNTSGGRRHYENRVELVPVGQELIGRSEVERGSLF